jgi:hypothetical protein
MTVLATPIDTTVLAGSEAEARLAAVRADLLADRLVPYLGPRLAGLAGDAPVPLEPEAVAAALHARAPVPGKIRTNMWSAAQFIEQRRHRKTLTAYMAAIFAPPVAPSPLHAFLAETPVSLIVDTWYDGAMRTALAAAGRTDFVEIQGVTRAGETRDIWTKSYDAAGVEVLPEAADAVRTVLYRPHGAISPAKNFLVADSDYVEVLTEIDIQTPIPQVVKQRREARNFLFVGCRFHDQMLRTWARQVAKRSGGRHLVVTDLAAATKNEAKFFVELGIEVIDLPLARAVEILVGRPAS